MSTSAASEVLICVVEKASPIENWSKSTHCEVVFVRNRVYVPPGMLSNVKVVPVVVVSASAIVDADGITFPVVSVP